MRLIDADALMQRLCDGDPSRMEDFYYNAIKDAPTVGMKVKEYAKLCRSTLKVLSAYNGKVLCFVFDETKHLEIAEREITSVWAEIKVTDSSFGNYAKPIMCAFVDGRIEYEKEMAKKAVSV